MLGLIRKEQPDIIHSHTDLPDFVLSITLKLLRFIGRKSPRIIRTIHNSQLWPTYQLIAQVTESSFKDEQIIGVSKGSIQAYKSLREKTGNKVSPNLYLIYNGIPPHAQRGLPFQLCKGKMNILFCGRFEYQKGLDILIDLIPDINKSCFNSLEFYFIGEGTLINRLKAIERVYANVYVYSPIPDFGSMIHNFDLVIMPSRFEGLPLLAIESLNSGVPVIAANAPGLNEALTL